MLRNPNANPSTKTPTLTKIKIVCEGYCTLTLGLVAFSRNRSALKLPSSPRHPKYPVPTFHTSPPPPSRWKREMPPSPVLW